MSAYIERPLNGFVTLTIENFNKLNRDTERLNWLDKQYEYHESWDDVFMKYDIADLRKVVDTAQGAK